MQERLQKLISSAGIASRRAAEQMIRDGRVTVNGSKASLGMSADPETDEIRLDGERVRLPQRRRYIVLNKPKGYVTTMRDDRGRPTVAELTADAGGRLYPAGRLDMDSEGLLILTDDGEAANALMHPSHRVDKVYAVFVQGEDIRGGMEKLRAHRHLGGAPGRGGGAADGHPRGEKPPDTPDVRCLLSARQAAHPGGGGARDAGHTAAGKVAEHDRG